MYEDKDHLLSGLNNKELKAYEELFFKYHGRLVLFARKFTGDIEIARDIVQDAFMALWEKSDQLTINESPKAYLFQAVRNRSLNFNRHVNVKNSVRERLIAQINAGEKTVYSDYNDPFYSLLEVELDEKINSVIESMPDKCQQAFLLSRKKHLSNKEIAEKMGISLKMVEKHISKALRILRFELIDYMSIVLLMLLNK